MTLLTRSLVETAIDLSLPTVREVVRTNTWGPEGLVIAVGGERLSEDGGHVVYIMPELGDVRTWESKWGEGKNFVKICLQKLQVSFATGLPSRVVVADKPWLLKEDFSLYVGAVAKDTGLAVACSGAYGDTDEACAWIVWNLVRLLCQREVADLQSKGINHL